MNCNSGGESFKFEIIDPIGHGQFSTVYKAKWLNAPVEQEVLVTPSHANQRTTNGLYCQQTSHAYPHQQQQQRQTYTSNNSVDLIDPRRQLENGFATNQSASLPSRASSTSLSVVGPGGLIDHGNNSQAYSGSINVRTCEKLVALKRVKFYEIPNSKERMDYIKEVDLLQKLKHPNIIHYNISFTGGNELFIVLELADGGDLSKLIKYFLKKKRLILEQTILKYFTQVCSAVEYIHSRRILHRDIKPANIFMTSSGCVKLGDFGLGRFFSQNTRDAHSIVGTFYYMSPERIRESGYGFSSDVWSLGCVLYELITLNSPFSIMNYEQNHINNLNCMDQSQVQYQQDPMMRKKPLMQHQQKTTTSTHQCYHQHQQPMQQQQQQQQQSYNLQWLIDRIVRAEYPSLDGYQNISLLLRDLVYKCLNPNPDARPNMQYMCSIVYQCFAPTSNSIVQHQQQNQTRSSSNSPRSSTYDIFVNE